MVKMDLHLMFLSITLKLILTTVLSNQMDQKRISQVALKNKLMTLLTLKIKLKIQPEGT